MGRDEEQAATFERGDARRIGELLESPAIEETAGNHLGALTLLTAAWNFIDGTRTKIVSKARADGHTWAVVGDALGTSKQTAFNRYGQK